MQVGFSGLETKLDSVLEGNNQPLKKDILEALASIRSQNSEVTNALRSMDEAIQILSRQPSPHPPMLALKNQENGLLMPSDRSVYTSATIMSNYLNIIPIIPPTGFEKELPLTHSLLISDQISLHLRPWLRNSQTSCLWLQEGPHGNTASPLGAAFLAAGKQSTIVSVIAHSCQWDSMDTSLLAASTLQSVVNLIRSLVYQLICCLPPTLTTDINFSPERFKCLQESTDQSLETAVGIVEDLLRVGPESIIFVLDGLQKVDRLANVAVLPALRRLFDVLVTIPGQGRVVKTLFTTPGQSLLLTSEVARAQKLNTETMAHVKKTSKAVPTMAKLIEGIRTVGNEAR